MRTWKQEPLWRRLALWHLWPLRWRGMFWFWVEERTRWGVRYGRGR